MQVNVAAGVSQSLKSSALTRQQQLSDFQAALAAASQSLAPDAAGSALAAAGKPASVDAAGVSSGRSAADELVEFLNKSVAERVRDAVLKSMGLSEEDLAAMPPEQRQAIEKQIAERVAQALSGLTDPSAQNREAAPAERAPLSLTTLLG